MVKADPAIFDFQELELFRFYICVGLRNGKLNGGGIYSRVFSILYSINPFLSIKYVSVIRIKINLQFILYDYI